MLLSELSETVWQIYGEGRQRATVRSFSQKDVQQYIKLAVAEVFRILYYNSKRNKDGNAFYFISPLLSIQPFELSEGNQIGMRRADMTGFDMFRMPHDAHIVSMYPIGCGDGGDYKSISLVEAGEEYFYAGNAKYSFFKFAVVKGTGLNTYNLPPCVKKLDVEASFDAPTLDPDISMDVAFDASSLVLGKMLGLPDYTNKSTDNSYSLPQRNLKQRLSTQQAEVPTNG
jgi:hypothetical protein